MKFAASVSSTGFAILFCHFFIMLVHPLQVENGLPIISVYILWTHCIYAEKLPFMGMIDNTKTKCQKSHINKIALNNSVQKLKEQISTGKIKYNIS